MNAAQPGYLSTLVVSFPLGEERFGRFPGWEPLDLQALFVELERFIAALELRRTVFRTTTRRHWR